jgi:hypothetical protein
MKRESLVSQESLIPLAAVALFLAGALALARPARADVDVRLDIGNAPPAPSFVFHTRPHRVYDRTSRVYVVDDPGLQGYDAFQYGGYYWLFNDGYWYRSRSWRGGFRVVQANDVPVAIYNVPRNRWKNHPSYASWHDHRGRHGMRNRGMQNDHGDQDHRSSSY